MLLGTNSLQQYLSSLSPAEFAVAKSELINIFRVDPWLARFYADFLHLAAANPNLFNTLQPRSGNLLDPDPASSASEGSTSMAPNQATRICSHIKVNGVRCGSPALRGEFFCYFHQRLIRGVRTPPKSRLHPMAFLEDEESIQASLMEVINALVRNTIDFRRAQLILRALHIATKNVLRTDFECSKYRDVVNEVPQYSTPVAPSKPEPAIVQAGALARIRVPKPVRIAPPRPVVAAATVDRTHRKPPARATTMPIPKSHAVNAQALRNLTGSRSETRAPSS
jgi:hypothetical protein